MSNFMQVKNSTELTADLYFYGDIENDSWSSFFDEESKCPNDVKELLDEVKGKDLNIYINSGGGSVFGGMAIYNMLKRFNGKKTVYIDGLAGSIASVIALAGDTVIMPSTAYMMIHKPWACTMGNADEMRKMADDLDRIQEGILNVYKENIKDGVDIQVIEDMVNAETWLTGDQVAEYFNVTLTDTNALNYASIQSYNYKNAPNELLQDNNQDVTDDQVDIELLNKEIDLYLV